MQGFVGGRRSEALDQSSTWVGSLGVEEESAFLKHSLLRKFFADNQIINMVYGELNSEVGQDADMHRGIETTSRVRVADLADHRQ